MSTSELLAPGGRVFARFPALGQAIAGLAQLAVEERDGVRAETARAKAAVDALREVRIGALRLPEPNGYGLTLPELIDVIVAIAAVEPDVPHALIQHFGAVEWLLRADDEEGLGRVADGVLLGAALTEAHDVALGDSRTRLTRTEDGGFVLTGRKEYTTGAAYVDVITVLAVDDDDRPVRVAVPSDRAGVEIGDDWSGIGQKGSASGSISFTQVLVDASEVSEWAESSVHVPDIQQLLINAVLAGIAIGAARHSTRLLQQRRRVYSIGSGVLPREDPLLQTTVGSFWAQAEAARAIVLKAASDAEESNRVEKSGHEGVEDLRIAADVSVLQSQATVVPIVLAQTSAIFDALGGSAIREGTALDRHWRNARTLASHNPVTYKSRQLGDYALNDTPPQQVAVTRGFTGVFVETVTE